MFKIFLATLLVSPTVMAIGGFKNLDFGMSVVEVRANKHCNLEFKETSEKAVDTYVCRDLKFGTKKTSAAFYFIKNKLERIVIDVGVRYSDMEVAASFLRDEFGSPSTMFDIRAIQAFNAGIRDELTIGFEDDTVLLKLFKVEGRGNVTLTYSTEDYYAKLLGQRRRTNVAADFFRGR